MRHCQLSGEAANSLLAVVCWCRSLVLAVVGLHCELCTETSIQRPIRHVVSVLFFKYPCRLHAMVLAGIVACNHPCVVSHVMCLPVVCCRYLRATDPFSLPDLRDEALLLAHQQQHDQAAALLREYLAVAPGAADAEMVREVIEQQMLAAQLSRNKARWQQQ